MLRDILRTYADSRSPGLLNHSRYIRIWRADQQAESTAPGHTSDDSGNQFRIRGAAAVHFPVSGNQNIAHKSVSAGLKGAQDTGAGPANQRIIGV
jgi:hypothetical protein